MHVDHVRTAVHLVRLAVAWPVQRRAAEPGLGRDLSRRLAVAVQLRLVGRGQRGRVMTKSDAGDARRFDTGARGGLDRRTGRGGRVRGRTSSGPGVTRCLGRRRRMPLCLDAGGRGDTALCLRLPLCLRGDVRVARGGNGRRAACLLLAGRSAVRVARRRRQRPGSRPQGNGHCNGDS